MQRNAVVALVSATFLVVGVVPRSEAQQRVAPTFHGPPVPVSPAPAPRLTLEKGAKGDKLPYWRRKPKLMKQIREERAVLVSVKQEEVPGAPSGKVRFTMTGAGYVSRDKDVAFRLAQEYPRLKEVSDHFKTVQWDAATSQLFVITEALGYQARMILKMTPVNEDWRSELQWEVVWGHFKGMTGVFAFERVDETKTEVSIQSEYEAESLPLPRVLMGFALEVITQKVAEKMRNFLESKSPMPVSSVTPIHQRPLGALVPAAVHLTPAKAQTESKPSPAAPDPKK